MKILFFSHYFPPEGNAPASRTYEHCVRWARAGHQVTVVTCVPNVPDGVPYAGYKNRWRTQREHIDGVEVLRVWTYLAPNAGFVKRILNYLTYMVSAVWTALFLSRPDVVIATSPQFFCGWAGVLTKYLRRRPLVLEIRDIWPESITAVGAMRKGLATRCLEWLEKRMYRSADWIVAVGNGYRDNVVSKAPVADRISVIYNGVDGRLFQPAGRDTGFLERYGLQDRFVCAYVGTIGMAHGLEVVLDAAERLRAAGRRDIGFLLVGDGARRQGLEEECAARGLQEWVRFTGRLDKAEMPQVLASSDCLLVHLRPCDLFETVIPSKIFEAMAMQRPILMGVRGESAEIVRAAGSGLEMQPGDADSLVSGLTRLTADRALYQQLCDAGRAFVLNQFSRDAFARRYLELLERVSGPAVVPQFAHVAAVAAGEESSGAIRRTIRPAVRGRLPVRGARQQPLRLDSGQRRVQTLRPWFASKSPPRDETIGNANNSVRDNTHRNSIGSEHGSGHGNTHGSASGDLRTSLRSEPASGESASGEAVSASARDASTKH
jgi:glycosyltransferase involved in cell wall biosynthesis